MAFYTVPRLFLGLILLAQCVVSTPVPSWNAFALDPLINNLGGVPLINETKFTRLYFGTKEVGMYAMSPMLSFFEGYAFLALWKVAPWDEDQAGQLIRFAQSEDGEAWINVSAAGERLSAPGILFPRMNSTQNPKVHLFAEPTLLINGHAYAASSPRQFCLYPDQYQDILLLRRVYPGIGKFGPIFWAQNSIPQGYEEASTRENVTSLAEMDSTTRADIATLTPHMMKPPCGPTNVTTKCEFCVGGCQLWTEAMKVPHMENERTHYDIPNSTASILLYRNRNPKVLPNHLFSSYRSAPGENWSLPVQTNITSDVANLNAGPMPDGRIFLTTNIMINLVRDPLYVALSEDGLRWTSVAALASCWEPQFTNPAAGQLFGCLQRHFGGGIQGGLQYPQAMAVTKKGKEEGFYAIFSQNKEDIWITKTPFRSFRY